MHPPAEQASPELNQEMAFCASIEAALRQSESQYRLLVEQAESGIFICDAQGKYISVNSKACQMLGYTREELLQLSITDVTAPIARGKFPNDFAYVLAGKTICVETLLQRQDGKIFPVELSAKMLENGQVQGIVRDITSRQRTLEALRANEARFQKLAANMPGAIYQFLLRPDGSKKIVYISSGCRDLYELEPEAVQQNADLLWSLTHPDDLQSLQESVIASALNLTPWHYEGRIITRSGKLKWIQGASRPEKLESGEIVWDGLLFDITARKMAEIALKESEEKYRVLIEGLNEAVFRISLPSGEYEYFSPAAKIVFGYANTEFFDNPLLIQQIIHPNYISYFQEKWAALCQGQVDSTYEYKIIDPAGKERWILQSNKGIFNQWGNIVALEGICRDITKSKLAEEQVRRYQEQLEDLVAERTAQLQETNEHLLKEIVDRQQVEAALRSSEARFRAAAEGSLDAFFIFKTLRDEAGRIVDFTFAYLNSNAEKMISMSPEEVIGKRLGELLPAHRGGGVFDKYVRVIETGIALEEEFFIEFSQEQVSWLKHQVVPLPDGVAISSRDITDRKSSSEALRQNEALYRAIVEDQTELICRFKLDGTRTFVNDAYCRYFGKTPSELIGKSFVPLLPDEDREFVSQQYASLSPENPAVTYEHRVIMPNGEIRWQQWTDRAVFDRANNFIEFQAVGRDITEGKVAEEALQRSYQRLMLLKQITAEIRASLDTKQILQTTVNQVGRGFGVSRSLIHVYIPSPVLQIPFVAEYVAPGCESILGLEIPVDGNPHMRQVLAQDKAIASDDVYTDPLLAAAAPICRQIKLRSMLAVRTSYQGQPNGVLGLHQCDGYRHWTEEEIELLEAVASQVGIALFQAQLLEQQTEQREQLTAQNLALQSSEARFREQASKEALLNQIANQIHSSLDIDTIIKTTLQEIRQLLQIDRTGLMWYRPDVNPPGWEVIREAKAESVSSSMGLWASDATGPLEELLYRGEVLQIDDAATLEEPILSNSLRQWGYASLLNVPFRTQTGELGALSLAHCSFSRPWKDSEVELMQAVAVQLAIAIDQAELYKQTQTAAAVAQAQAQRQELLNCLVSQIRASLDLNTILETAVNEVYEFLQPDRCLFVWYRLEGSSPYTEVVHEVKKSKLRSLLGMRREITNSDKVTQRIFNKEIFQIVDAQTATSEQTIEFLDAVEYRALLALPIHTQSGEIGLISCSQAHKRRNWSDTEVELLKSVADQLAIAIDQAELYTRATTSAQIATEQATKLEAAMLALQKTQTQLIQSEKMSSLGQMVAGIAHEINNPISFIYGNVDPATRYIDDLLHLIALYQQHYPMPTAEIQDFIEEIDLDFTIQDLPKVMSSMKMGATRIRDIVRSLRSFSRLDEADLKPVSLHEGIDNTMLILEHRLKANASRPAIELIKEYGELPPVECYAGQLNQVFMNLLCNAIDALEERVKQEKKLTNLNFTPTISIHTEVIAKDWVTCRIADNGGGIPEDILPKIFDPFFTTKPVGSGTGMGLAISYQIIVERHQGRLSCRSQPGKGTEFIVEIPLRRQQLASNTNLQVDIASLKE